jgi:hypothetical protein
MRASSRRSHVRVPHPSQRVGYEDTCMPGGRPASFRSFTCPNCQALYHVVQTLIAKPPPWKCKNLAAMPATRPMVSDWSPGFFTVLSVA